MNLRELATSAGARVIDEVIQHRHRPDPATYIGKGKVEELREQILVEGVDVVIFDDELSPSQAEKPRRSPRDQGRRSDGSDPRHLRQPRPYQGRKASGRTGAAELPTDPADRLPRLPLASRRRNRNARSRRNKAGNGSPADPSSDRDTEARDRADSKTSAASSRPPAPRSIAAGFSGRLHECRKVDSVSRPVEGRHAGFEPAVFHSRYVDSPHSTGRQLSGSDFGHCRFYSGFGREQHRAVRAERDPPARPGAARLHRRRRRRPWRCRAGMRARPASTTPSAP